MPRHIGKGKRRPQSCVLSNPTSFSKCIQTFRFVRVRSKNMFISSFFQMSFFPLCCSCSCSYSSVKHVILIKLLFSLCTKQYLHSGEEIPDPVDILSRIASMEASITTLQQECNELTQQRQLLAGHTTSLLLKNYRAIQEVSRK